MWVILSIKFSLNLLGKLVRPRVIDNASILEVGTPTNNQNNNYGYLFKERHPPDLNAIFGKKSSLLFQPISLGNTTKSLEDCYVAEITHLMVRASNHSEPIIINAPSAETVLNKILSKKGKKPRLRIKAVGVRFYKGVEYDKEKGVYIPLNPWNPLTLNDKEAIWFYYPRDVVPIEEIIKFEGINPGDLIIFQKVNGLTIKKTHLNKPKFYSSSSWSCYTIFLMGKGLKKTRMLPNREFTVIKSK